MSKFDRSSSENVEPFLSLTSLRYAHNELLKRKRQEGETAEFLRDVEHFIYRAQASGVYLDDDQDRYTAQNFIDYWENRLFAAGKILTDTLLAEFDPNLQPEIPDEKCPYVGLDAFRQENAPFFFGRSDLIKQLVQKLSEHRLLAVVGASGSGKSSVVLAGLLPVLQKGALPGSEDWHYFPEIVPGSTPLVQLAQLLVPPATSLEEWQHYILSKFYEDPYTLQRLVDERVGKTAVLTIDQFEETFTLCRNPREREAFLDNLLQFIHSEKHPHRLILTMRTDYEPYLIRHPLFHTQFEEGTIRLTAMNAAELREAIEEPAEAVGLKFERGLVNEIINDIIGEPAALPLLQFTLRSLWDKRERNRITWDAYHKLGGVTQALAKTADDLYESLIPEDQQTFKRILLQLVRPSEKLEVTRNRIRRKSLYQQQGEDPGRIDRVLQKLIDKRLVHLTKGTTPDDDQLEVTHEALVRNWPRLVEWIDEARDRLRKRQRLSEQAQQWETLGRDPAALLRGRLLQEALQFNDLNELETEYVHTSKEAEDAEKRAEEEARQRELEQAKKLAEEQERSAKRARYLAITLAVMFILVVAGLLLGIRAIRTQADAAIAQATSQAIAIQSTIEYLSAQETISAQQIAAQNAAATAQIEQLTATAQQIQIATAQAQVIARNTAEAIAAATAAAATATIRQQIVLTSQFTPSPTPTTTTSATTTENGTPSPTETPTATVDTITARREQYFQEAQVKAIVRPADNMVMLYITGDTFMMGASPDDSRAESDEKPAHSVTLPNFYMDLHEVTVKQFATFLNEKGDYRDECEDTYCVFTGFETQYTYLLNNLGFFEPVAGFENFPVNWVSWYGAKEYCEWADARLPTEAEWEYAARGIDGRIYPWGNTPPTSDLANFGFPATESGFFRALVQVDQLPGGASFFGLLNMAGNVQEWVEDWYDPNYYATNPGNTPNEDHSSGLKVLRGGSWESGTADLRATARTALSPQITTRNLNYWGTGFRCAKDAP